MDEAWHPQSKRIVLADELWEIENPQKQPWQCPACGQELQAIACDPARRYKFKVRPYFKGVIPHRCDKEGEELVKRGQTQSVLQERNLPVIVYNQLKLDNKIEKIVDPSFQEDDNLRTKKEYRRDASTLPALTDPHNKIARSIRALCAQYINFPHDRRHPLAVPGVSGSTYREIFQPLRFRGRFSEPHIFIGELVFKLLPQKEPEERVIIVTLRDKVREEFIPETATETVRYRIRIDMRTWLPKAQKGLLEDIDCTRAEAAESYRKKSPERPWIFFLGSQDRNDPILFHVSDRRLVCCFNKEITWPQPKRP